VANCYATGVLEATQLPILSHGSFQTRITAAALVFSGIGFDKHNLIVSLACKSPASGSFARRDGTLMIWLAKQFSI
jgi:hypothetical protein